MHHPKIFDELGINQQEYFLTGSRALDNKEFNIKFSHDKSDYDYVVSIHRRHLIIAYLRNRKIKIDYSSYNGGFKFMHDGKLHNIITTIDCEFMAWRESLSIIQHLILIDEKYRRAILNKQTRYCIYEQLRGLCKTMLCLNTNLK